MQNLLAELYIKAGIEAVTKWGVTSKTEIMHTTAWTVAFPKGHKAIKVQIEPFMLDNGTGAAVGIGYCAELDLLLIRSYPGD